MARSLLPVGLTRCLRRIQFPAGGIPPFGRVEPPADLIPCGGFPPYGRVVPPADLIPCGGRIPPAFGGALDLRPGSPGGHKPGGQAASFPGKQA